MNFLLDNDVPEELSYLLDHLGHQIRRVREALSGDASDAAVRRSSSGSAPATPTRSTRFSKTRLQARRDRRPPARRLRPARCSTRSAPAPIPILQAPKFAGPAERLPGGPPFFGGREVGGPTPRVQQCAWGGPGPEAADSTCASAPNIPWRGSFEARAWITTARDPRAPPYGVPPPDFALARAMASSSVRSLNSSRRSST